jgi:ankyrin repeat protein
MSFYHRGDPDKTDYFGNTCLHLAAARGHEFCVKFLVKFGCNIWSLDIDRHSARELAAINSCERILQFLDLAQADQELNNRKKSRLLREKAEKDAEKRCSCVDRFFFASDFLIARERRNVGMISLHLS